MSSALTKAMKRCFGPAVFLQCILERGVQWDGVMGLCYCCTTVMVPLLRFHRCLDSVRIKLVQGRSMSSALTKAMKRCFGPAAFLQRFGSGDMQWGGVMGLCYCCTTVTVPPLRYHCCGFTVSLTPFGQGNHMVIPLLSSPSWNPFEARQYGFTSSLKCVQ